MKTARPTSNCDYRPGGKAELQDTVRVFQPFFVDLDLPVALTRHDEVAMPAVVYNYRDKPQTVTLKLKNADWYERLDRQTKEVRLGPGGSWSSSRGNHWHDNPAGGGDLATTVYVAWAIWSADDAPQSDARLTREYLLGHSASRIDNPYQLALVTNALLAIDKDSPQNIPYIEQLAQMAQQSADGDRAWWNLPGSGRTTFHGAGASGDIETTALATLALLEAGEEPTLVSDARRWLIAQKDANGMWHSTQATVLALKALMKGTDQPLAGDQHRRVRLELNGKTIRTLDILADQAEVMQRINLSDELSTGTQQLRLVDETGTNVGYQVSFQYHMPAGPPNQTASDQQGAPLAIDVSYEDQELRVNQTVETTATVRNRSNEPLPMVLIDLPVPAGFQVEQRELKRMVESGKIARFEVKPRSVTVYLRGLRANKRLTLNYSLRPTMPVEATAPPAHVYEYYQPDREAYGESTKLTVKPAL
jgi:uncharacterized protein YfaS (alpha-2-macroglobulin family)